MFYNSFDKCVMVDLIKTGKIVIFNQHYHISELVDVINIYILIHEKKTALLTVILEAVSIPVTNNKRASNRASDKFI